jgi:hypothetical protein
MQSDVQCNVFFVFVSYVLDQILSAEVRDTIVENIAEYLNKGESFLKSF